MRKWIVILLTLAAGVLVVVRFGWQVLGWLLGLPTRHEVGVETKIPITMPDGVRLMTDHYFPKSAGRFPTILIRSTYGRGTDAPFPVRLLVQLPAYLIAACGYHVIAQTTRGRFDSEGSDDEAFADAGVDGHATLEWIRQQRWFDGNLSMFGSSYLAYVQWAVVENAPPFLKAIAPSLMTARFYDIVYPEGALALDTCQRWALIEETIDAPGIGLSEMGERFGPDFPPLMRALNHLPISETDHILVGKPVPYFQNFLRSTHLSDPLWRRADLRHVPAKTAIPVHFMGGWYDFCLNGMLEDYADMVRAGGKPYLTIGGWSHSDLAGQVVFLRESITWYEAHLKGDKRRLRHKPVRIYVMGANHWREMESWPPPTREMSYYLNAKRHLSVVVPTDEQAPDSYQYDPAYPTPAVGGALFMPPQAAGQKDNHPLESRADVLVYTSPVLSHHLDILGVVKLELYVRSSAEHTDFFGRMCDVQPDGLSLNVCDGLFRVEPGKGERQPDGTLKITVSLGSTAYRFSTGHYIRLQVSSAAHPRWSRNTNTGEPVADATQLVIAQQQVYHDAAHPSVLVLPVSSL